MPNQIRDDAVTYHLAYSVQFSVQCESTVVAAEQQTSGFQDRERIYPRDWELSKACTMGENSWIEFQQCDGPFDTKELARVTRNLQLLDDAFKAMTKGTKAEGL